MNMIPLERREKKQPYDITNTIISNSHINGHKISTSNNITITRKNNIHNRMRDNADTIDTNISIIIQRIQKQINPLINKYYFNS